MFLYMYIDVQFSNSLKMMEIDRNMSQLCQILCEKYYFNISVFVDF
jgi:hypothetical protein